MDYTMAIAIVRWARETDLSLGATPVDAEAAIDGWVREGKLVATAVEILGRGEACDVYAAWQADAAVVLRAAYAVPC